MSERLELQQEVEQFLYREVRLLSDGQYRDWLDLFTDDARYWMPSRITRPQLQDGVAGPDEIAIYDDDKHFLAARVQRLSSELAHAERPPSRLRYFLGNVEVDSRDDGTLGVACNMLVYQSRLEKVEAMYVGKREDVLMRKEGRLKISSRKVVLDQTLLPRSISIFF